LEINKDNMKKQTEDKVEEELAKLISFSITKTAS